jgi:hypothetical protein
MKRLLFLLMFGLLLVCGMAAVAQAQGHNTPTGSPLPREVAIGNFYCSVDVVDPPAGTGIPHGLAGISFMATAGITDREIGEGVSLGDGEGLEEECQTLSAQFRSAAQALNCIPGPIRFRDIVGGNFTGKEWTFDVVCIDGRDRVMNAIGNLLVAIVTTPLADEVIHTTDTTDLIERSQSPFDVREWSSDAYSVKKRLSDR